MSRNPAEKGGYLFLPGSVHVGASTNPLICRICVNKMPHLSLIYVRFLEVIHRHFYESRKNGNSPKSLIYAKLELESEAAK